MADAEFGDAVVAALRERGWNITTKQIATDVFLVAGDRTNEGTEQLLALVGSPPTTRLTRDHVEHLLRLGERDGADRALIAPRDALTREAAQLADEDGVALIEQGAFDSAESGTDGTGDGGDSFVPQLITPRRAVVAGVLGLGGLGIGGAAASQVLDDVSIGGFGGTATQTPDGGPETVVREYFRAVASGDEATARALVHDESSSIDDDQLSATELTVHRVERITPREVVDSGSDLDSAEVDAETADLERDLDEWASEIGVSDYGLVLLVTSASERSLRTESIAMAAKDDGEWFVFDTSIGVVLSEAEPQTATATDRPRRALRVTTAAGAVTDDDRVGTVLVTVGLAPGRDEVDLRETTAEWTAAAGGATLTLGDDATAETFSATAVADENGSLPKLDAAGDRAELAFDPAAITGAELAPEASVTLTLRTASEAETSRDLAVPATLSGDDYVEL